MVVKLYIGLIQSKFNIDGCYLVVKRKSSEYQIEFLVKLLYFFSIFIYLATAAVLCRR